MRTCNRWTSAAGLAVRLVVALGVALCTLPAAAQRSEFTRAGTIEFSGDLGFNIDSGNETSVTFVLQPEVGVFVAKGLELNLSPGLLLTLVDGESALALTLLAGPSYNVDLGSNVFPFVGVRGGITQNGSIAAGPAVTAFDLATPFGVLDLTPAFGGELGAKFVVGQNGVLRAGLDLLVVPYDADTLFHLAFGLGGGLFF